MKFSALTLLIAGAGLASVNANPLRVTLISSTVYPIPLNASIGVAVMRTNMTTMAPVRIHRPCGGMRLKALHISNALRKLFGLPLIAVHSSMGAPTPIVAEPSSENRTQVIKPDDKQVGDNDRHHHHAHQEHHHKSHHFKLRHLWKAFIHLGGWEGAAVAFVVGCGIGVVLRLMWVMTIIAYRFCTRGGTVENVYEEVPTYDGTQVEVVAPPQYIEKAPIEEVVKEDEKVAPSS